MDEATVDKKNFLPSFRGWGEEEKEEGGEGQRGKGGSDDDKDGKDVQSLENLDDVSVERDIGGGQTNGRKISFENESPKP